MNSNCCNNDLSMINGNSIDIAPQGCDSEIKADIVVSEFNSVRLWGQIVNCFGEPVANALLKLVKVVYDCSGKCVYQGIAHSVSDCHGFYQFDLCVDDPDAKYKVLVNKSAVGTERIIQPNGGNCNACSETSYSPCSDYQYRVTPPDYIDCTANTHKNSCGCNDHHECNCGCNSHNTNKDYSVKEKKASCNSCTSTHSCTNVYAPSQIRF